MYTVHKRKKQNTQLVLTIIFGKYEKKWPTCFHIVLSHIFHFFPCNILNITYSQLLMRRNPQWANINFAILFFMSMASTSNDKIILHFGFKHLLILLTIQTSSKELYLSSKVQKVFIFQIVNFVLCQTQKISAQLLLKVLK